MISIVIASKNRFCFIQNLIQDLYLQIIQDLEIIIVDQSDKPYKFTDLKRIIHILDDQRGPCHARNLGLEKCTGEIIVFLDDDIRIANDFLKLICTPIINHQTKVVVGAMQNPEGQYSNTFYPYWIQDRWNWLLSITASPGDSGMHQTLSFTTCCAAIHRSVYENVGGFDEFFDPDGAGEDREYGLRIFHAGFSILYEGKAAVRHLGAPSGGRRGAATGFKYQNILESNSVYIVAKYFGWQVFDEFCASWLRSIIKRGRGLNPRKWIRSFLWWLEAKKHIENVRSLKQEMAE